MCGEQPNYPPAPNPAKGSPPRVRGTVVPISYINLYTRITPACAGNSVHQDYFSGQCQDHPRVCGEQAVKSGRLLSSLGSPPRVRGTVLRLRSRLAPGRITPACAGNSPPLFERFR